MVLSLGWLLSYVLIAWVDPPQQNWISHLQLGKLIALYDDNHITIDGDTAVSFTEDVVKRFEAYGWHVQIVSDGDHNMQSIQQAIEKAKTVTDKPSLIKVHTTIGFGSLNQGEEKVHGAPLERKYPNRFICIAL